jgi:hypothetical protein
VLRLAAGEAPMQRADEVWGKTLVFRNEMALPLKALPL